MRHALVILAVALAWAPAAHAGEPTFRGKTAREWARAVQNEEGTFDREAIVNLGEMGPHAAVALPQFLLVLDSRQEGPAWCAAEAVGNLGPHARAAVPALVRNVRRFDAADHRESCIQALAEIGEAGLAALVSLAQEPDEDVRFRASQGLLLFGERAVGPLAGLLTHKDAGVRNHAIDRLMELEGKARGAVPALRRVVRADPAPRVRLNALVTLLYIDPEDRIAKKVLVALSKEGSPEDRKWVMEELGFVFPPPPKVLLPVVISLLDPDGGRTFAHACAVLDDLGIAGAPAVPALRRALERATPEQRFYISETLVRLGPKGHDVLTEALQDPDPERAFAAAVAACRCKEIDPRLFGPALLWGARHDDARVRQRAFQPLDSVPHRSRSTAKGHEAYQEVIRLASQALAFDRDRNVRMVAADALGYVGRPDEAVPALCRALRDPDLDVRISAVRSLGRRGHEARGALSWIRRAILEDKDSAVSKVTIPELPAIVGRGRELVALLADLVEKGAPFGEARSACCDPEELNPEGKAAVVGLLRRKNPRVRMLALRVLRRLPQPQAVSPLSDLLLAENVEIRREAACALGRLGPQGHPAVPRLRAALDDKDFVVHVAAARALGRIGPAARPAQPVLLRWLKGEHKGERWVAAEALAGIGPRGAEARAALLAALSDDNPDVRLAVVEALGKMGPETESLLPQLSAALEDHHATVRVFAAEALGGLGPRAAPAVPALGVALQSRDETIQARAAWALGEIGPAAHAARPALRALGTDTRLEARRAPLRKGMGFFWKMTLRRESLNARLQAERALKKIGPGE